MTEAKYSLEGIHLPSDKNLLNRLTVASKIFSILALFIVDLNILYGILQMTVFKTVEINVITLPPINALLFIILSLAALMPQIKINQTLPTWQIVIVLASAGCTLLIGLAAIFRLDLLLPWFSIIAKNLSFIHSLNFILLSLTLLLFTLDIKFVNRFRLGQLFAVISATIALFFLLQNIYFNLLLNLNSHSHLPISAEICFLLIAFSLLLVRTNRGYMSVFTTDTISSKVTWTFIVISMFIYPILGFFFLVSIQVNLLSSPLAMALMVTLLISISAFLIWLNMSTYYKLELDSYLIKEELRVRNIKLSLNSEDLGGKIKELEQNQEKVVDLLNHQQNLKEVIDQFE
jgi:hypothetical protein